MMNFKNVAAFFPLSKKRFLTINGHHSFRKATSQCVKCVWGLDCNANASETSGTHPATLHVLHCPPTAGERVETPTNINEPHLSIRIHIF